MGFEKALGAVKVIKDQIQYRSQSLLNLARGYFSQLHAGHCFSNLIDNLLLLLFNYMLLSLIILNARLAVLEPPNRGIDQVHNAAFSLISLKQITAVLQIDMVV